ncbi:MAG: ABC transporter permease, partial [Chitinophagaceae bacterium]
MIRNYLLTAIRNLTRYKGFSAINIASLTIGIAGCLLIGLFVWDERSYDRFPAADRTYRFYDDRIDPDGNIRMALMPPTFAPYAQQQFPEVEATARVMALNGRYLVEAGNKKGYEEAGIMADSSFFSLFPLPMLHGDAATALRGSKGIVLSEELANKYFGSSDPVGQTLVYAKEPYQVTGVLKSLPARTHLKFSYVLPLSALDVPAERMQRWGWNQFFTYVRFRPGTDAEAFIGKFRKAVDPFVNAPEEVSDERHVSRLQPVRDIHLGAADFQYEIAERGNGNYVNALSLIAVFVLLIAGFNFVNLATARSMRRAREVGVRKVVGAGRRQLLVQFTVETIFLSLIAVLLAAALTALVLPALNEFTGKELLFNPFREPLLGLGLLVAAAAIGVLAGLYPSLVLARFRPVQVLKGSKGNGGSGRLGLLRQGLVVIQFSLSALLIVCALSVFRQVKYLQHKELGFQKDQVLTFQLPDSFAHNVEALKAELLRSPDVLAVTAGYGLPGDIYATDAVTVPRNGGETKTTVLFGGDEDYAKTLGLQIVA